MEFRSIWRVIVFCCKAIPKCFLLRGKCPPRQAPPSVLNKRTWTCTKIIAAMNFSEYTSLGKHASHCSLDIDKWIILDFIFNVCDGHTCWTDLVDRTCPELSVIREYFKVNCWVCFLKGHQDILIMFWNIKSGCSFPVSFVSLLLFALSGWKSCFRALSGNGWVELKSFPIFRNILLKPSWARR